MPDRPPVTASIFAWPDALAAPPRLAPDSALFLDIDGTLLELAQTPSAVEVDHAIVALLPALSIALKGAVALVTGRAISDVDRLFPGITMPIGGQHGCERRDPSGTLHLHAPAKETLSRLRLLLASFAARHDGLLFEDKGATLALHYRLAPALADTVHQAVAETVARTAPTGFALQPGKQLIEVRPEDRDKGRAIADFMQEPPFAGRRPVFVGDDASDEHGFSIVRQMQGVSVKVGTGPTRAQYRLADVNDVRRWLSAVLPGAPR